MARLADSIVDTQEAALEASRVKDDPMLKARRKVPQLSKNAVLYGGVEEDGTIPKEPTEERIFILTISNGADAHTYLSRCMKHHNNGAHVPIIENKGREIDSMRGETKII